jgi:hypothetical protein
MYKQPHVGGDYNVGGKNWAWSLKWAGQAGSQGTHAAGDHAAFVAKQSIEIVRRNRVRNQHLAGFMPFSTPFYYW